MQRQVTSIANTYRRGQLSPQFLLRVSGLPINTIERLRFVETQHWSNMLQALESRLLILKEQLVDLLHDAVSLHKENRNTRRLLINFKRDVFNMRPPTGAASALSVASALSQEGQLLLQEWLDLWQTHKEARTFLEHVFQEELVQKRILLKDAISHPDFRKGLLLASPLLSESVDAYLASDNQRLNREARTVERSLVEYLQRTACKTSPFSTLTSVCIGHFTHDDAEDGQDIVYQVGSMEKESFTNLNLALLSRLSSLILSSKELWPELPVQLAIGWQWQGDRVRYVRRKQQIEEADEEAAMVIDLVQEELFYLPKSQCLTLILQLLEQHQVLRTGELIARVCQHPAYRQLESLVTAYVEHLLRLGLLTVPALHLNIHSQHPLQEYCQNLLTLRSPLIPRLTQHLQVADSLITDYASATFERRRGLLKAIREEVRDLYTELGQPDTHIPRTLLYEDTLIHPEKLQINEQQWDEVLADLAEFQQLLPVFDMNLPKKLATRGYFLARYGAGARCDDFLAFADVFNNEFFLQYARETIAPGALDEEGRIVRYRNHLNIPALEMLNDARQAVADYMRQAYHDHSAEKTSFVLDSAFFETIAPLLPKLTNLQTHTFFSQFARVENEPLLTINRVYSGLTTMFSRFARYFSEEKRFCLVPDLRATLSSLQPPDAVFAEIKGGYDATNLNLHPCITSYELVCPGETSSRPAEEQIPLTDLYLRDNPQTQSLRLYSKRLDKEVIPVYLGFLVPMMLPNIQQVLLNFSSLSLCFPDLWSYLEDSQPDAVVFYPRLRYKHLVLQRAMWKLPLEAFPQRNNEESAIDFYQRVIRWSRQQHLPRRVFLNIEQASATDNKAAQVRPMNKPMYVDFENYFSVSLLESTLRNTATGQLILREMLPSVENLWFEHEENSYVTEILLEMNCPAKTEEERHAR